MKKWLQVAGKISFRAIGVLNIALALMGAFCLVDSVVWFSRNPVVDPDAPHLKTAFYVMTEINFVFLISIFVTAVCFIRLRARAMIAYAVTVALLIAYEIANGLLWLPGHGIGASVAGATGIGNCGTARFRFVLPYDGYPILSTVLVLFLKKSIVTDPASTAQT